MSWYALSIHATEWSYKVPSVVSSLNIFDGFPESRWAIVSLTIGGFTAGNLTPTWVQLVVQLAWESFKLGSSWDRVWVANCSDLQNWAPKLDSSPNSKPSNLPFQLASSTRHLSFLTDASKTSVFSSSHHHILEPACPPPTVSVNILYSLVTHAQSCWLMTMTLQQPTMHWRECNKFMPKWGIEPSTSWKHWNRWELNPCNSPLYYSPLSLKCF
jgi:hypothetical protein